LSWGVRRADTDATLDMVSVPTALQLELAEFNATVAVMKLLETLQSGSLPLLQDLDELLAMKTPAALPGATDAAHAAEVAAHAAAYGVIRTRVVATFQAMRLGPDDVERMTTEALALLSRLLSMRLCAVCGWADINAQGAYRDVAMPADGPKAWRRLPFVATAEHIGRYQETGEYHWMRSILQDTPEFWRQWAVQRAAGSAPPLVLADGTVENVLTRSQRLHQLTPHPFAHSPATPLLKLHPEGVKSPHDGIAHNPPVTVLTACLCRACHAHLRRHKRAPPFAIANGNDLGHKFCFCFCFFFLFLLSVAYLMRGAHVSWFFTAVIKRPDVKVMTEEAEKERIFLNAPASTSTGNTRPSSLAAKTTVDRTLGLQPPSLLFSLCSSCSSH
jgi:hypothetical protein